ncbi:MAG: PIG-L family deacetylase [Bacteroidales bacterium]|nr:PIG-L family deacetylase [Bacteroidales bacterium]
MKNLFLFLFALMIFPLYAQDSQDNDSLRNMLIITCHPDDWELSMAGTAYLLKDQFNIHVIIASDGERGNSKEPDPEVAALRVGHAMKSAKKINAKNHFFRMMDGEIFADEVAVNRTVKLLEDLDPALIFLHWPIDKPDHAAASAMAMMALSKTGMMYNREIYFFEVGLLNHFNPEVFVDVTPVWDIKKEVVQIHERFNDDRYERMAERSSLYHGRTNRCKYAEGFIPLFPLSNVRFRNRIGCSLLDL